MDRLPGVHSLTLLATMHASGFHSLALAATRNKRKPLGLAFPIGKCPLTLESMNSALLPRLLIPALITLIADGASALAAPHALPADLAPYFAPPAELLNVSDGRRSPLLRPDGSRITDPRDWPKQRAEIRRQWF